MQRSICAGICALLLYPSAPASASTVFRCEDSKGHITYTLHGCPESTSLDLQEAHNPTPGNATLTDRDGEWVISTQGGASAEGDWPVFTDAQWKKTNGHYGHGCACMKVVVDRNEQLVLRIASATAKPLKACREDRALPRP